MGVFREERLYKACAPSKVRFIYNQGFLQQMSVVELLKKHGAQLGKPKTVEMVFRGEALKVDLSASWAFSPRERVERCADLAADLLSLKYFTYNGADMQLTAILTEETSSAAQYWSAALFMRRAAMDSLPEPNRRAIWEALDASSLMGPALICRDMERQEGRDELERAVAEYTSQAQEGRIKEF